jgi:hypothetical protein
MATLDEFSDLVSLIYDAALDFERWPIVLERLADALGGSATGLAKHNFVNNGGAVVTARADPVFGQLYAQHYANLNVLFQRAGMVPVETCLTDRDVMPKAEFFRSEFYNDSVLRTPIRSSRPMCLPKVIGGRPSALVGHRAGASGSASTSISCDD